MANYAFALSAFSCALLLCCCWSSSSTLAADVSQLVTGLPGQPQVPFNQYAGYVTVNESHGRALFYWFFESYASSSSKLPLVLWLNGGPGCSSVGGGALYELGPFFVNGTGNGLLHNPHTWTKAAHIIFLESPYGVGFSYSNTSADYKSFRDQHIAEDAHAFLVGWFKKFPEYRQHEFYLAGESYAGHYIPTLACVIVRENKSPDGFHINFKGFIIGNPWTDAYSDNSGLTQFYFSHSIISEETYNDIKKLCDFNTMRPIFSNPNTEACTRTLEQARNATDKLDSYNIYGFACNTPPSKKSSNPMSSTTSLQNPCIYSITPYLNLPKVQATLHVEKPREWMECSNVVPENYNLTDFLASMIPIYQKLLKEGLKIWIYSGDVDGVVPTIGTKKWIKKLSLPILVPWYAWDYNNQVGGWTEVFEGLTFATIRGAGHMVPTTKPAPALSLFRSFLAGKLLPKFNQSAF